MLKKKNILDKEEKTMTRNTEESAHFSFAFWSVEHICKTSLWAWSAFGRISVPKMIKDWSERISWEELGQKIAETLALSHTLNWDRSKNFHRIKSLMLDMLWFLSRFDLKTMYIIEQMRLFCAPS
jgi:hypothetical protein